MSSSEIHDPSKKVRNDKVKLSESAQNICRDGLIKHILDSNEPNWENFMLIPSIDKEIWK